MIKNHMSKIEEIIQVQQAAKLVLEDIASFIGPTSTERSVAEFAKRRLADLGFPDTWYYDCPALVLLGSRSCISPSGKDYVPSDETVGKENLVTVDLSPCQGQVWGDCARSFVVESGTVVLVPSQMEFQRGLTVQSELHKDMLAFVRPETKFDDLYEHTMDALNRLRYENLDASRNFGHSICSELNQRVFLAAGNTCELGAVTAFTFEPHIRAEHGTWGFKHENIYYFDENGIAQEV